MRKQIMDGLRKAGASIGTFDDRVQGAIRYQLGERNGRFPEGQVGPVQLGKTMLGDIIHADRSEYTNDWQGKTALYGSRALQAGGLTAAGVSLANLTNAIYDQAFGGEADGSQPGQLPLN